MKKQGKSVPQATTSKEDEADSYDSKIDEMYRPFLIHSTTYVILTEQILSLMPFQRNVLLTMNEYEVSDINPTHQNTDDSPTHIIIFCIRFVSDDVFQPIGGLLIYKYEDQSYLLAECVKAYINDLWKLGLHVVASVSPPFETFKGILSHLVDIKDFDTYSGVITYSVTPFKEIVHIYDIQFLLVKLQTLFKEGDIRFVDGTKEYQASWYDISLVLNLSAEFKVISKYLLNDREISRRVHIFSQQIFSQLLELEAKGVLTANAAGSAILLNCVRSFLQFTELELVDLSLMCKIDGWDILIDILQKMTFQKSNKRTCTKKVPSKVHTITKPSTRRKIDFQIEENIEKLAQNVDDNLLINEQEDVTSKRLESVENEPTSSKKKGKKKKSVSEDNLKNKDVTNLEQSATSSLGSKLKVKKQHLKKPYEKIINVEKLDNTSVKNEETDRENKCIPSSSKYEKPKECLVENKPCSKTDNLLKSVHSKSGLGKFDNLDLICDKDNNSDESLEDTDTKIKKSTTPKNKCDSKIKIKKSKKKVKEENFDIVINDPKKFFECFSEHNRLEPLDTKRNYSRDSQSFNENSREKLFSDIQGTSGPSTSMGAGGSNYKGRTCPESFNDFCTQSDEETENRITESCDKVPNIIELLSKVANKEKPPDEFEQNKVSFEMLNTITGMKKLMENLINRRVKRAKPDAFVVEHIDFLVSTIKRDKNNINPVYYYGLNYSLLNAELAFVTLQNNIGLYLVSK